MSTPDPRLSRLTTDQRRATLTLLEQLPADAWEHPSLCEGWTIHHLVAHLTLPYTSRQTRVMRELVRARGSFDRAADRIARQDAAEHSPAELIAICRDNLEHPWNPPGGGPAGALAHDVIHSWDITDALGLPTTVEPERAHAVLESFRPIHLKGFGTDLRTTRIEATDDDLAIGAPAETATRTVREPLLDLIPVVTGRRPATPATATTTERA